MSSHLAEEKGLLGAGALVQQREKAMKNLLSVLVFALDKFTDRRTRSDGYIHDDPKVAVNVRYSPVEGTAR